MRATSGNFSPKPHGLKLIDINSGISVKFAGIAKIYLIFPNKPGIKVKILAVFCPNGRGSNFGMEHAVRYESHHHIGQF